ncbi:MAG TPA: peptidoglycan DD-metalloendopeptidase family protein [Cytophagaceae bacterium]|nr:peptidoglycan DD-metalloendopeptidase family protein [Cytophagaceae bacterium]
MRKGKLLSLLIFLTCLPSIVFAQKNKGQLERERLENIKKIKETEQIIQETKRKKEATLGQLTALSRQIEARKDLISSIEKEVEYLDEEITELEQIIASLEQDLIDLKAEYARMVYAASKLNSHYDKLTFIFAAENFNQMVMRVKYFKQYAQTRQHQVEQIEKVKSSLESQKKSLARKKSEKNNLITAKIIETKSLNHVKTEKNQIVKELSNKEKDLLRDLEASKKSIRKLDKLIADLVKKEIEKMKAKAALENKTGNTASLRMTPEAELLSNSFAGNASKLPWPVTHGTISQKFGRQPHPILTNVEIDNLGINILTLKSETVRSVFQGKVVTVAEVPGMNKVVMIQHGEFFTVYARLRSVSVEVGEEVTAKESIGEVYTDKNDVSELQFQIWKNSVKQDPEKWLFMK